MRSNVMWAGVTALPMVCLVTLLGGLVPDPAWQGPRFHFLVVTFTTLLALAMALLMVRAATQLRDVRVLFLALAYSGIAGVFLVHALTTPGALVEHGNPWVGFSAAASLCVGAVFFALGTVRWRVAHQERIIARRGLVLGAPLLALLAYGVVAVSDAIHTDVPAGVGGGVSDGYGGTIGVVSRYAALTDPVVGNIIAGLTLALLVFVVARYRIIYRTTPSPLGAAMLIGALLLAQAQITMALTVVWHASWWEYHLLMLAAFGTTLFGIVQEHAGAGSVDGVIAGLLLRDTMAHVQRGYTEVIVALVEAVEAKDPYTRGHTQRVAALAVAIGREMHLPPEEIRTLNRAALLHDIGKIGVPDAILGKPGRLTDDEFAVIKEHPLRGYTIVANVRSLRSERAGIRSHHERLDGSGYPDGLAGAAIPLAARIIAVADVFDALTSPRPYRGAWPRAEALAQIDAETGARLDPAVVAALHTVLAAEMAQPQPSALAPMGSDAATEAMPTRRIPADPATVR